MNTPRCAEPASRRLLLTAGVLALAIASGCDGKSDRTADADSRNLHRASGIASPALKVGDTLPPLQAEGWVNGTPPAPGAPGVRLLVVDAWGVWCPFCAGGAPGLVRVYEKYSSRGVAFVSITNTERDIVQNFVKTHSVPWPSGYGATVEMIAALGAGSGMPGPSEYEVAPTVYLVGPDGRIRWTDDRGRPKHQSSQEWERAVDEAIAQALSAP